MKYLKSVAVVVLSLLSAACGGEGGPASPTVTLSPKSPSSPQSSSSPQTTPTAAMMKLISVADDAPVVGATVNVAGDPKAAVTNERGEAALTAIPAPGAAWDAVGTGFMPRLSVIRASDSGTYSLIPWTNEITMEFLQELVYHQWSPGNRLSRPNPGVVYLRLSPEIANDEEARWAHDQAAATLTAATEGKVTYIVSDNPPTGASVYDMVIGDTMGNRALTYNRFTGNIIAGNKVVYFSVDVAGQLDTVVHELGHTLGLGHSTRSRDDIMWAPTRLGMTDFSPAEKLIIKAMPQRYPGTEFPDNDRNASAMSKFRGTITIECGAH